MWLVDTTNPARSEYREVELDVAGEIETLRLAAPPPPADEPRAPLPPPPPCPDPPRPLLPLAAEIVGGVAGLGLLATGVALLVLDGQCSEAGYPPDSKICPRAYDNTPQAPILIGLGGALALSSGVMLTIDATRIRQARHYQATLTWTLRF